MNGVETTDSFPTERNSFSSEAIVRLSLSSAKETIATQANRLSVDCYRLTAFRLLFTSIDSYTAVLHLWFTS